MTIVTHFVPKSSNGKIGPIPATTSTAAYCPKVCPLRHDNEGGCYADYGPQALHWKKVTAGDRGITWDALCDQVRALPEGQLWRHNVSGDLPGDGEKIDSKALVALVRANNGRKGFTYTHYPVDMDHNPTNNAAVWLANARGFTINLSANNLDHADQLAELEIGPVAVVLEADQLTNTKTPKGRSVVVCPAVTRDDTSCATCQLCALSHRKTIIGFPAHGTGKKKAAQVVRFFGKVE